jgi:hypothetical protein
MKTLNPCTWVRRVRYPQTPEGRSKFIKDSLNEVDQRSVWLRIGYLFLAVIGIAGMCVVLLLTIVKSVITTSDWLLLFLGAVFSMGLLVCGVHGFDERRGK